MKIKAKVLFTEGCGDTPPTMDLVRKTASEMGLEVELETIRVIDQNQAEELKFLGSPTVLIDDLDIEPAARDSTLYGFM